MRLAGPARALYDIFPQPKTAEEAYFPSSIKFSQWVGGADWEVLSAAGDLMTMARLLNTSSSSGKMDPFAFYDAVAAFLHQLIAISPIVDSILQKPRVCAIYLGLLSFMTTLLFGLSRQRRPRYELLAKKCIAALDYTHSCRPLEPATRPWLLCVAGIGVLEERDSSWLLPRVKEAASNLCISSWIGGKKILARYLWIDVLHDNRARSRSGCSRSCPR